MPNADPKISEDRPIIRQLDQTLINQIAAGEVIERPASAVKELVENALDAGAGHIRVDYADGGKRLIRVVDDGCGMGPDDLPLALSRHATSKLQGRDLLAINAFGFRGEALASLGAVGRLTIKSRARGDAGHEITCEGGTQSATRPAALNGGTQVDLADLFYATPARLKFMRTDRAEAQAIADVIRRLAMAEPTVRFELRDVSGDAPRKILDLDAMHGPDALADRLAAILGRDFAENALRIDAQREEFRLSGYAALPTYSRGAAVAQFLFVGGRPVRDKLLVGALRAAYSDFLSRDRHPAAVLFVDGPANRIDVNVHPAKAEVRFRDPGIVRGLIVSGLRHALAEAGHRASTTVAHSTLGAMRPEIAPGDAPRIYQMDRPNLGARRSGYAAQQPVAEPHFAETAPVFARVDTPDAPEPQETNPLGAARGQVHENYIIAQTTDGLVIVDQHAAHERLVYEKLKTQMQQNGVASQALLIPEIIDLSAPDCARLLSHAPELARFGLVIEPFGGTAVAVRETPAVLGHVDAEALVRDVMDALDDGNGSLELQSRIEAILSRIACHGSIRSGRRMRAEEMNALLREMEATPHSGQCNHGRPTYVELKLADIERLFGRT